MRRATTCVWYSRRTSRERSSTRSEAGSRSPWTRGAAHRPKPALQHLGNSLFCQKLAGNSRLVNSLPLCKLDTRQTQWHLPSPRREPLQRAARPRAASRRPSRVTAPDRRSPLVPSQRLSSKSQSRLPTALQRRRSASTPKRSSTFPPSMPSALLESRSPTVSRRERLSSTTRSL